MAFAQDGFLNAHFVGGAAEETGGGGSLEWAEEKE